MEAVQFPRYEKYKDSGVPWLGEIPEHWEVKPGFSCIRESKEKNTGMKEETVLSLSYGKIIVRPKEKLTGLVPESFGTYQIIKPGDIIIRPTDLQNDKVSLRTGIAKNDGIITSAYLNLRSVNGVNANFIHYLLHSYDLMKVFYGMGSGLRQNLDYKDFKRLPLALPTLDEAVRIVSFLDQKTAEIDAAIAKKQQLIQLLNEQKAILINRAVTKGLNPDVKMKDSGVEWIGEIPEHWDMLANRSLFSEVSNPGNNYLPILTVSLHTGVSDEEQSGDENIRAKIRIENKANYKHVEIGDVVFNMMRAWQGAIGAVRVEGMVSPAYIVARPKYSLNSSYFEYLYRTDRYIEEMDRHSKGITDFRKRLYWDEFKKLKTMLPPIDEQTKIASYCLEMKNFTDSILAKENLVIEKLQELKQTLITYATTGKIKV